MRAAINWTPELAERIARTQHALFNDRTELLIFDSKDGWKRIETPKRKVN